MLLPEHKFLIEKAGPKENTKDQKHSFKTFVFRKPGFTNEFGEKVGKDDLFEAKAWNKTIDELPAVSMGDKVAVMLVLNGKEYLDQNQGINYSLQLTIQKMKVL